MDKIYGRDEKKNRETFDAITYISDADKLSALLMIKKNKSLLLCTHILSMITTNFP